MSSIVSISDDVTFSGDENTVWTLQIAENVMMNSDVYITFIGGAEAKNIFCQVAGEAKICTTDDFEGIILLNSGASLNSRVLDQTAAIFDANGVVEPQLC